MATSLSSCCAQSRSAASTARAGAAPSVKAHDAKRTQSANFIVRLAPRTAANVVGHAGGPGGQILVSFSQRLLWVKARSFQTLGKPPAQEVVIDDRWASRRRLFR